MSFIPSVWFVGFSGCGDVATQAVAGVIRRELERLKGLADGLLVGHSSALPGADFVFLEQCEKSGIPIEVSLPSGAEEFLDAHAPADRQRVVELMQRAVRVNAITQGGDRQEAFLTCGVSIVDAVDLLVAVWNEHDSGASADTANVIAYARALNRPLVWIHPESLRVVYENMPTRLFEDVQTRAVAKTIGARSWAPEKLDRKDCHRIVDSLFRSVKALAATRASVVRRLAVALVVTNLAAVLCGGAVTILHAAGYPAESLALRITAIAQWFLLMGALAITASGFLARRKNQWIACRFVAELCRSLLATWDIAPKIERLPRSLIPEFAHIMRSLRFLDDVGLHEIRADAPAAYLQCRVDNQENYYRSKTEGLEKFLRLLKMIVLTSAVVAPVLSALSLLRNILSLGSGGQAVPAAVLQVLTAIMPVIGTSALSMMLIFEIARRLNQNRRMLAILGAARIRLSVTPGNSALVPVVRGVEEALLGEAADWFLHHRHAK